ncbi:hypothetical protein HRI_003179400 [Hibiscus trionum]|uniref:Uncharacterized protein n=1 Tax=Hibiscus trionum TaxID=183268 RepID=A0A9W7IH15_HIBTR|nr:hypothetical protein HRI_003179400 [Hibiscus trionum]
MYGGNFAALYRGIPSSFSCGPVTVVNIVEKFLTLTLRKIPLFGWITMYSSYSGLSSQRRRKQMLKPRKFSEYHLDWQPKTRFTFYHAACEQ